MAYISDNFWEVTQMIWNMSLRFYESGSQVNWAIYLEFWTDTFTEV